MLVDRPYSGTGMRVRQFGRETQFSTAAAMLAHHTGASIVPAFVLRQPDTRYRAMACAPVEQVQGDPRETLAPNVQKIADLFESIIRQYPEQWFNYVPVFSPS
jgi:lauroyl/myristoyl acyltransferase